MSSSTRRAHTKSRKGCQTCKTRKVRCDEFFPQCRNCTKRRMRCAYMDDPAAFEGSSPSQKLTEFEWPSEIERGVDEWRASKTFPFPHMQAERPPNPDVISVEECRLLYHICTISKDLVLSDSTKFTTWAHKIPEFARLAVKYEYAMQAFIALSATHLACTVKSAALDQIAFLHRGNAFRSLSEAVGMLTQDNSDAVLAASAMLSWQSPSWRAWAALMQGIKALRITMQPWRATSEFKEFLDDNLYELAVIRPYRSNITGHEGLGLLEGSILSLERAMSFASKEEEQVRSLRQLLDFVQNLRISPPGNDPQDQYQALYPLRAWVVWIPMSFISVTKRSLQVMVTLAHFYAVTLAAQLHLPLPGPAYYPKMRMQAIEALTKEISFLKSHGQPEGIDEATELMSFPIEIAAHFRGRLELAEEAHRQWDTPAPAEDMSMADSFALAEWADFESAA